MTFAADISTDNATQPSDNALLGIVIAVLAVIAVVVIGFLFFMWRAQKSSPEAKSSHKVDKEIDQDKDPT